MAGLFDLPLMSPRPPDQAGQVLDVALQILLASSGQLVPGHRTPVVVVLVDFQVTGVLQLPQVGPKLPSFSSSTSFSRLNDMTSYLDSSTQITKGGTVQRRPMGAVVSAPGHGGAMTCGFRPIRGAADALQVRRGDKSVSWSPVPTSSSRSKCFCKCLLRVCGNPISRPSTSGSSPQSSPIRVESGARVAVSVRGVAPETWLAGATGTARGRAFVRQLRARSSRTTRRAPSISSTSTASATAWARRASADHEPRDSVDTRTAAHHRLVENQSTIPRRDILAGIMYKCNDAPTIRRTDSKVTLATQHA